MFQKKEAVNLARSFRYYWIHKDHNTQFILYNE